MNLIVAVRQHKHSHLDSFILPIRLAFVNTDSPSFLILGFNMFDRKAIYQRFQEGYGVQTSVELIRILGVKSSTVSQWKTGKRQVPWERMKVLVNEKGISWDWLIDGKETAGSKPINNTLNRGEITKRFVEKLPKVSQAQLAKLLSISQVSVHKIMTGKMFAPWDKLRYVIYNSDATWHWLMEGL